MNHSLRWGLMLMLVLVLSLTACTREQDDVLAENPEGQTTEESSGTLFGAPEEGEGDAAAEAAAVEAVHKGLEGGRPQRLGRGHDVLPTGQRDVEARFQTRQINIVQRHHETLPLAGQYNAFNLAHTTIMMRFIGCNQSNAETHFLTAVFTFSP